MIKSWRMRWAGYVARMGKKGMHIGYWWESQKVRDHWEDQDNIKMNLKEIGYVGMHFIYLALDRDQWRALMNTIMNFWVP
jgi:hypothetical protein